VANIPGLGPDTSTIVNERGAKQSELPYLVSLEEAILWVFGVLHRGAKKYGRDNWEGLSAEDHVDHAIIHLLAWNAQDESDDHLGHAACRALMALDTMLKS